MFIYIQPRLTAELCNQYRISYVHMYVCLFVYIQSLALTHWVPHRTFPYDTYFVVRCQVARFRTTVLWLFLLMVFSFLQRKCHPLTRCMIWNCKLPAYAYDHGWPSSNAFYISPLCYGVFFSAKKMSLSYKVHHLEL